MSRDNEYYARLSTLMAKGGTLVAEETLKRHMNQSQEDADIDKILKENTDAIIQLKTDKKIDQYMFDCIFPTDGSSTNLGHWNAAMLCSVTLQLFPESLGPFEKRGLEEIFEIRKILIENAREFKIAETQFQASWARLTTAIGTLMDGCDPDIIRKGNEIMFTSYSGRIETDKAVEVLREMREEWLRAIRTRESEASTSQGASNEGGDDDLPVQGSVRIRLKCSSAKGLLNIWDNFKDGGDAQANLNKLSALLSEKLGSAIQIQAKLDVNQFKDAVDSAAQQIQSYEIRKANVGDDPEDTTDVGTSVDGPDESANAGTKLKAEGQTYTAEVGLGVVAPEDTTNAGAEVGEKKDE